MFIALAVALTLFSLFLHELGHACYMRKYGVSIKTFSIGLPFPFKIRWTSRWFLPGTIIQLTPLLLGAYVEPSEEGLKTQNDLPYVKYVDIFAAGPIANFWFGGALILVAFLVQLQGDIVRFVSDPRAAIFAAITLFSLLAPKFIGRFLFIPLGFIFLAILLQQIVAAPTTAVAGPIGIAHILATTNGFVQALRLAGILSVSLGLFNILPLIPLDGGRIAARMIGKIFNERVEATFQAVSTWVFFALVIFAISSDLLNLRR